MKLTVESDGHNIVVEVQATHTGGVRLSLQYEKQVIPVKLDATNSRALVAAINELLKR